MRPKVSIVVPVYNVRPYINKCLKSLVSQTFQDIEIIVVNDGSPDSSQEIIDIYAAEYPEIVHSYIKENGGLSDARNFGIKLCRGDYISFVDSDDYLRSDMIEKMYTEAIEKDSDIVICDFSKFTKNTKRVYRKTGKKFKWSKQNITGHTFYDVSIYENPRILRYASSYAWNKLYKRTLFTESNIEFPTQWFEDSAIIYNILALANRVSVVHERLYKYRIGRPGAITSSIDPRIFDIFKSCDSILNFYKSKNIISQFSYEIEYICIMHLHARLISLAESKNIIIARKFVDECFTYLDTHFPEWRNNPYYARTKVNKIMRNKMIGFESYRDNAAALKRYYVRHALFAKLVLRPKTKLKKMFKKLKRRLFSKNHKSDISTATVGTNNTNTTASVQSLNKSDVLKKSTTINEAKAAEIENEKLKQAEKALKEVKSIQKYSLRVMQVFHNFCKENNLTYFLAEGSLLGAVRHHGFIPWDDDMDVCMPREDYDRFIKLWNTQKIENCKLMHNSIYKKYYLPFMKIILCEETGLYNNQAYFPREYHGPFIDIFPLDKSLLSYKNEKIYEIGKIRAYRDYLLIKIGYIKNKSKRRLLWFPSKFTSYKQLHKKIYNMITQYKDSDYGYVANFCSSYTISRETFKSEWFKEAITVPFDGYEFDIPCGYDEILTKIYGDYSIMPPENKRICKHGFTIDPEIYKNID